MEIRKKKLLGGLDLPRLIGVEIGPLHNPLVRKDAGHVIYVDHKSAEALRKSYVNDTNVKPEDIHVDAIWGQHTLKEAIDGYFHDVGTKPQLLDYVVASHVIEHVPDLVTWLKEIRATLKSDGVVRLAVPDKRFTFDYLRKTSDLTDAMVAYVSRARMPNTHALLDFCLNEAPVDRIAAWQGKVDPSRLQHAHTLEGALAVARDALQNGTYHDVHCWVFTPKSFAGLFSELALAGLIDFACETFHDTVVNGDEFIVNLRISGDKAEIVKSWHQMADQAKDHLAA